MKEQILNALKYLGFEVEELDDAGYHFQYEGINYLYMYNDNDENFLDLAIPAVHDIDETNELDCYRMMNSINSTLKYVKAYSLENSIWLYYERELSGDEDLYNLLTHMILSLHGTYSFFAGISSDSDDNPTDSEADAIIVDNAD